MSTQKRANFFIYQKEISHAESNILRGNYNEAIGIFKAVSENYSHVFPRDMYLAAQVASFKGEKDIGVYFLEQSVLRGCNDKALKKNPHINALISQMAPGNFQELYNEHHTTYRKTINNPVKIQLEKWFRVDRSYYINYHFNIIRRKNIFKLWNIVSEVIAQCVTEVIRNNGFPSYKIVGTDTVKVFRNTLSSHLAVVLLAHAPEKIATIDTLLHKEAKNGNLPVKGYAFLRDVIAYKRMKRRTLKGDSYDDYIYGVLTEFKGDINTKKINESREKAGLLPGRLEEEKRILNTAYLKRRSALKRNTIITKPYFHFLTEDIF